MWYQRPPAVHQACHSITRVWVVRELLCGRLNPEAVLEPLLEPGQPGVRDSPCSVLRTQRGAVGKGLVRSARVPALPNHLGG